MVLIHLQSVELNHSRIATRVSEGGHNVPAEKVISRVPRLLEHVRASIPLLDVLRVIDNSSALDPFRPVFTIRDGHMAIQCEPMPDWAAALLADDHLG